MGQRQHIVTVPDDHGIPRNLPANDYQLRVVRSLLTGEPMSVSMQPNVQQQQAYTTGASQGSLPSASSLYSSQSSFGSASAQPGFNTNFQRYMHNFFTE